MIVMERTPAGSLIAATRDLLVSSVVLSVGALSMTTTSYDGGADIGGVLAVRTGVSGVLVSA